MKSQKECHEALCAGKTLINRDGDKIRYNEGGLQIIQLRSSAKWVQDSRYFHNHKDWAIYEAPSATYDEAVKAKAVRIYGDGNVKFPETPYKRVNPTHEESHWPPSIVALFHLAEAHHYRMEVVE